MTGTRKGELPDAEQRNRIKTELGVNMLVEAAAGTGKTTMLLERMVELIRTGRCQRVSNIAAITFTRKAAAELRSRFQVELEKTDARAEGEERERLDDALHHVEQCFIGTIHSFCARLLRERPLESGTDISFEEIDDSDDELLLAQAWEEFAATAIADDPDGIIEKMRAHRLEFGDLAGAFVEYAESHDVDEWPLSDCEVEMPTAAWMNAQIHSYVEHMERVHPELPDDDGKPERLKERYRTIPLRFRQNQPLNLPAAVDIIEILNGKAPSMNQELKNALTKDEKQLVKGEQDEWKARKESIDTAGIMEKWLLLRYQVALEVLEAARRHYDGMRERAGVLNFQDLLMKAAALLREHPRVRRYFSGRYTHVLVDEFQDTDPIQAEMMLLLTASDMDTAGLDWLDCVPREGALFVVGDPKQSIYRFRRADIATYNLVKEKFQQWEGAEVLELFANFRSGEEILEFVDVCFCDEFEAPGTPTPESPSYVRLVKCRSEANEGDLDGVKTLRVPCDAEGKVDRDAEVDAIARFIVNAVAEGHTVARRAPAEGDEPEPARVTYGDFMIITRIKDELDPLARKLQELGAPCQVSGSTGLAKVPELKMLLACLKAAANPDNPVLAVAALRSELFGISDQALYRFKKARGRFDYRVGRDVPAELPGEEREAFANAFERLGRYSQLLSRLPVVTALERIAEDLGLFALAGAREGGDVAAGSIAKALEILRCGREGRWTLPQALETLEEISSGEIESDGMSALPEKRDAVRIMNLHKVKGLQAPVVFLAGVSKPGKFPSKFHVDRHTGKTLGYMEIRRPPYRKDRGSGTLVACPFDWGSKQKAEDLFADKEKLRLRYVAATRAESLLVISLSEGEKEGRWSEFEDALASEEQLDAPPETRDVPRAGPASRPCASPEEAAAAIRSRLARSGVPTYGLKGAKEFAQDAAGIAPALRRTPIEREMDSLEDVLDDAERGVYWGTVVHALLEFEMASPAGDLSSIAASLLEENGLDPGFAADAVALVESVKSSGLWKRAKASDRCMVEVPFSMLHGDAEPPTLLRGKIDLVFHEDDGWVIVDYKTDRPSGPTAEPLVATHEGQVRLYADAWKACSGEEVMEVGILFVATGEYAKV